MAFCRRFTVIDCNNYIQCLFHLYFSVVSYLVEVADFAVSRLQTVTSIDKNDKIFELIIYKKISTVSYTHIQIQS
jgi:hypothetical protein